MPEQPIYTASSAPTTPPNLSGLPMNPTGQPNTSPNVPPNLNNPASYHPRASTGTAQTATPPPQTTEPQTESSAAHSAAHSAARTAWQQALQFQHIRQVTPWIVPCLLAGTGLAAVRYFDLSAPVAWAWQTLLFAFGIVIGHLLFIFEGSFNQIVERIGSRLAARDLTNQAQPATAHTAGPSPAPDQSFTDQSQLRQVLILLILPILAFYLVSSSRSPVGLGFLLGLSCVYAVDILNYLQGKSPHFVREYFKKAPHPDQLQLTVGLYLMYFVALVLALLFWR